jgi:hypothetical protein
MDNNYMDKIAIICRAGFVYIFICAALGHFIGAVILIAEQAGLNPLGESDANFAPRVSYSDSPTSDSARWKADGTFHRLSSARFDEPRKVCDETGAVVWQGRLRKNPNKYLGFSYAPKLNDVHIFSPRYDRRKRQLSRIGIVSDLPVKVDGRVETWRYDAAFETLIRYDERGCPAGALGAQGFSEDAAAPFGTFRFALFHGGNPHRSHWVTDRQVYEVDLKERRVIPRLPGDRMITAIHRGIRHFSLHAVLDDGTHHVISFGEPTIAFDLRDARGERLNGLLARNGKKGAFYLHRKNEVGDLHEATLFRIDSAGRANEIKRVEWVGAASSSARADSWLVNLVTTFSPVWLTFVQAPERPRLPLLEGEVMFVNDLRFVVISN